MDHKNRMATDIRTHTEVSGPNLFDSHGKEHERHKKLGLVLFTLDSESQLKDVEVAGSRPEAMPGILQGNAVRLLGLA